MTTTDERPLTAKQEAFAAALAKGVSQAQAYRTAFPSSTRWKDQTVWSEASRLAGTPKVSTRVVELQSAAARSTIFTLADHLRNLEKISKAALKEKDFTAAARAEEARGKASGFYIQKLEHTGKGGGPIETKQTRDLTDAELQKELKRHGIQP